MRGNELPAGYQFIDEVRDQIAAGVAPAGTVIAWDEQRQHKVWMSPVSAETTLAQAVASLQDTQTDTSQFEIINGISQSWLMRPIPDHHSHADTVSIEDEEAQAAPGQEEVLTYPEEWVTGRRQRAPMSTINKRKLGWVVANGLAFSLAFGYDPEWSHQLSRGAYFVLGGGLYAMAFGTAQWAALRDRLREPGKWFAVAAFGQALTWFLLYYWSLPLFTVFGAMGLTAFLHLKFSPEAIKNPRRWMVQYPLAWTLAYYFLWAYVSGMSYTVGAIPGVLIAMMTMFVIRFQTKEEAA